MGDQGAQQDTKGQNAGLPRLNSVSNEVWRVVELAAKQNSMPVEEYIEKALLDEAIILEQTRLGRAWLVRDERGRIGEVEFR